MLIPGLASSRSLRQLDMSGVPLSHQVAAQLGEALAQGEPGCGILRQADTT